MIEHNVPNLYPKILVINGEPFNLQSATGITLSNLFRGWPKDRIAQVYTANIKPDLTLCESNWRLSNKDLFIAAHFFSFLTIYSSRKRKVQTLGTTSPTKATSICKQSRIQRGLVPWVDLIPYYISPAFLKWLLSFNPDVVYSTLGNIRLVRLVEKISRLFSAPVVPHFMDDWLATYSASGRSPQTFLQRIIINKKVSYLMSKRVPVAFAIGEAMAKEYELLFHKRFESFMNPVSVPSKFPDIQSRSSDNGLVRFVYIGGLHLSRWQNLTKIAKTISTLKSKGLSANLTVFAPAYDIAQFGHLLASEPSLHIGGSLKPEDIPHVLWEADVAVHVESFNPRDIVYTRLSVSTKIPQYMAAGRPILAFGPASVASCCYIDNCEGGIVVGHADGKALEKAICLLALDEKHRKRLGWLGWKTAQKNHLLETIQENFRAELTGATTYRG